MSMRTVPTPPVLPDPEPHLVQAYPIKFGLDMALEFAALDWDELPWWRRALARWLTGRDWGEACRGWARAVPVTEEDRHHAVMVDREELKARFASTDPRDNPAALPLGSLKPFEMKLTDEDVERIFPEKKDR